MEVLDTIPLTPSALRALTANELSSLIADPLSETADYFDPIAKRFTSRRAVYQTEKRRRELFSRYKQTTPPKDPPRPRTLQQVELRKGGASCR